MMLVVRSHLAYWTIGAVFLALFLFIGDSLSMAPEGELGEESVVFPAGVANPKEAIAYVSTASGIEAMNLEDGSVRWTTDAVAKPLMVSNGKLVAEEPAKESDTNFVIVVLNAFDGKVEFRSANIRVDLGTTPQLREQEISFAGGKLDGGIVTLNWNVTHHYRGGANPPLEVLDATKSETVLTVHLDLRNQKIEVLREQRPKQEAATGESDVASSPYVKDSTWRRGPWAVGNKTADLVQEKSDGQTYLALDIHEGSSNSIDKKIRLQPGTDAPPPLVTPDSKYVVVGTDSRTNVSSHSWAVYSVETGQKLGLFESRLAVQEPSVIGDKIFFISQETQKPDLTLGSENLNAVDLQTGKLLWKHALRSKKVGKGPKLPQ
jgi:outer membrane protein assembly factor BamB